MKTLETERLILRPWSPDDLDDLHEYAKDPEIGPNAGWEPHTDKAVSAKILQMFIEKGDTWAMEHKQNHNVIGSIGLHADRRRAEGINVKMIGYVLSRDYWGTGLMTEAARRVLQFAFEDLAVDLVSVYHYPSNMRSRRVIEKCGFTYEGTIRQGSKIFDGTVLDDVCYSMTKEEYEARK